MCTLSWLAHTDGYEIFFNRDEQRHRPRALLPACRASRRAIYPLDPPGGGTWVALSDSGVTFCLLNHYQADQAYSRPPELVSRGQLIPALLTHRSDRFSEAMQQLSLSKYRPFVCCCFDPERMRALGQPEVAVWDGEQLRFEASQAPMISSSVAPVPVTRARRQLYLEFPATRGGRLAFHRSHIPAPSAYSVCMHREDAATQSLSHVQVQPDRLIFDYYDGAPCSAEAQRFTLAAQEEH